MTALSLLERVDPLLLVAAVLVVLLAGAGFALVIASQRDDRKQASRVIALRSITTYVSVPRPVDADWRDEYGRPW
jgi:hypothetical protein